MKASLTSTSTSIESMSTMVQMPVRVKPPPAEIGEIISPGWALRSTTTPANGARMLMLRQHLARTLGVEAGGLDLGLRLGLLRPQHSDPGVGLGQVGLGGEVLLLQRLDAREDALGVAQVGGDRVGGGLARDRPRLARG